MLVWTNPSPGCKPDDGAASAPPIDWLQPSRWVGGGGHTQSVAKKAVYPDTESVLNQEQLYERYQGQLIFEAYYDDQGQLLYAKKQFFVE